MADTHDTIDGLLAEFRGYSHGMPLSYHVTMSWADFRKMLDRLEAAHMREVATTKESLAVGNSGEAAQKRERGDCAKLREAMSSIKADILKRRSENVWYITDSDILGKIDAALAAPPRNCDRFGGDIDKLREACARERGLNPEEDFPDVFPGWLLAPATEKEGGAK